MKYFGVKFAKVPGGGWAPNEGGGKTQTPVNVENGTDAEGRQPFQRFPCLSAVATAARSALKRGGVQGRCPEAAPVRRVSIHPFPDLRAGAGGASRLCSLRARSSLLWSFVYAISPPAEILASTQPVLPNNQQRHHTLL